MTRQLDDTEALLAELTDTAYRVALKHGPHGPFLDLELGLWSALRGVLEKHQQAPRQAAELPGLARRAC